MARQASRSTCPVMEADHRLWMQRAMQENGIHVFIAQDVPDDPRDTLFPNIGYGRLEGGQGTARLSYYIDAPFQGKGYGAEMIRLLAKHAWRLHYHEVAADVRLENTASIRALLAAGFEFSPVEILTLTKVST